MKVVRFFPVEGLLYDKLPINKTVLNLVFFIMSGGEIPPIKIQKTKDGWKVNDGRHRLAAYKLLGMAIISCVCSVDG
jgi:hypothetical protein